jgi:hypothetical protein
MMDMPHKVTLRVVSDATGKKIVVCDPSKLESNRIKLGDVVRFEAADESHTVEMGFGGDAAFEPGSRGTFFQEFTATTAGAFEFTPSIRLADQTLVEWAPGAGGQGQVQ